MRYPRGGEGAYRDCHPEPVTVLREGNDLTILAYGIVINDVLQAADQLAQQGISVEVVKLAQVAPLELAPVLASLHKTGRLLAVEDVCAANCIGEQVLSAAGQAGMALKAARLLNLGNGIIPHGAPNVLKTAYGLDARAIVAAAQAMRSGEKEGTAYEKKVRLDQLVFDQGLSESRERAKAIIMSGVVYVNGQRADKPGAQVAPDAKIEVRGNTLPYVSRGGFKLEKALKCFRSILPA